MNSLSLPERQFLSLLGLGLWGDNPSEDWSQPVDWDAVQELAIGQAVLGLCFDGLVKLPTTVRPPRMKQLEWWTITEDIVKDNKHLNKVLAKVCERFADDGLHPVLLKGQGVGQYYGSPSHRNAGDIDLYFDAAEYEQAVKSIEEWEDSEFEHETIYHRSYRVKGEEVEIHSHYQRFYHPSQTRRWQRFCNEVSLVGNESHSTASGGKVAMPQPQHNVIYVFMHAMHHLMQAGVGLRQMCDWLNLWLVKEEEIDKSQFLQNVELMRVRRAMTAVVYIAETYMGFRRGIIPLDATTRQAAIDGEFLLRDILQQGNFGKNSEILEGMERNNHLHNLKNYWMQIERLVKMRRFAPQEALAYPIYWVFSKV